MIHRPKFSSCLLLAFCCLVATKFASAAEEKQPTADYQKLLDDLYWSDKVYSGEETLQMLKDMRASYLTTGNADYRKQFDNDDWLTIMNQYIAASDVKGSKCYMNPMLDLAILIETTFKGPNQSKSLRNYIKQLGNAQFGVCKPLFDKDFQRHALSISGKEKRSIDSLFDTIIKAKADPLKLNAPKRPYDHKLLAELDDVSNHDFVHGLFDFIRTTNLGLMMPFNIRFNKKDRNEFDSRFRFYLREVCSPLKKAELVNFANIYEPFLEEEFAGQNDEFAWEWVTRIKVCNAIQNNIDDLARSVQIAWIRS